MIYFTWIKCYKTCDVSSGIPQGEIYKGLPTGKGMVPENKQSHFTDSYKNFSHYFLKETIRK